MNSNSKAYLEEYSKTQDVWLQYLIKKLILNNGNLSDEIIEEAYDLLLTPKELIEDNSINSNIEFETKSKSFYIENLTHISGVNALKENQTIIFNKNVTVLYGQNGSGKSGYFKILNEIAGGNEEKKILPNIYDEVSKQIEVKIKASSNLREIIWQNETRGILPFNKITVFDTSYVNGLLSQRASQEALVEPMGLHLFASLIKYIDEIKGKINDYIVEYKSRKTIIDFSNFSDTIKNAFTSNTITKETRDFIEKNYEFSKEKEVDEIEKHLKSLKSTNFDTEVELLNEKINKTTKLIYFVKQKSLNINNLHTQVKEIVSEYAECKKSAEEYQKKIDIINQLPLIDTKEWKTFITSAKDYENLVDDKERCIYCNNPLNENSKKIINAYAEYLNNDIIQKNDEIDNKITVLKSTIIKENSIEIDTIIETDYKEKQFDIHITKWNKKLNDISVLLDESLEKKSIKFTEKDTIDFEDIIDELDKYSKDISAKLTKLSVSKEKKNEEIKDKETELKSILENQSISKQKDIIIKWFNMEDEIEKLEKKKSSISTTAISTLSKKAHNELLTENLKKNFRLELDKLGHHNLNVNLVEAGTSKGIANTKLVLNKENKISDILSEGEQKAVALAMFFAEINLQTEAYPIVLDDPVTSLDNNVMKSLVERLLELDNQIIIFTHNAFFLSLLETPDNGHICKNMKNGCSKNKGKHIYLYDIKEVSNTSKGLVISKDADNSETHLEIAREYLDKKPRGYELQASSEIRLALEKLIDEKILLNITPQRYSSKTNRINWDLLKQLGSNQDLLDTFNKCYDRVSGGKNHVGLEASENPLQEKELKEILDEIEISVNP